MNKLDFITRINQLSHSYAFNYVRISNPVLKDLYKLAQLKFKSEDKDNELFERILTPLRHILYNMATCLIPYCNLVDENKFSEMDKALSIINKVYSEKDDYSKLMELLTDSLKFKRNLITEFLQNNLILHASQRYAIVTKRDLDEGQKLYIRDITNVENIFFYNERIFKKTFELFDYVIYVGNESYYDYSFNNSPRGHNTYYITYDLYQNEFCDNSMFSHLNCESYYSTMYKGLKKNNKFIQHEKINYRNKEVVDNEKLSEKVIPTIEEPTINKWVLDEIVSNFKTEREGIEKVEAHPVELTQGRVIFLSKSGRRHEVLNEEGELSKKQLSRITVDHFLLIRNDSETSLIKNVADELFKGESINYYRRLQMRLKEHLRKLVNKYGLQKLCGILHKKGLKTMNEMKIQHLLKTESFKLQNNEEYKALLLILFKGKEDLALKYFEASRRLAAFHIRAGRSISQKLKEAIKVTDLTELYGTGSQKITLPEYKGASFTIEKIINIGNIVYLIPSSQEKRILDTTY